jgi:hypothetical protein
LVGIPVITIYFGLDFLYTPALFAKTAVIRIFTILYFFAVATYINKRKLARYALYFLAYLSIAVVALMNWYIVFAIGRDNLFDFIAGYTELLLGGTLFPSWPSVASVSAAFFITII